jgi:hypothetical protein
MNEDAKLYKVSLFHHLSAPAASFSKSTTKQSPQYERWNERKQNLAHSRTIKQKSNVSGLILKLIIFDVVRHSIFCGLFRSLFIVKIKATTLQDPNYILLTGEEIFYC